MAKKTREIVLTRNYLYKYILQTWVLNRNIPDPETGERSVVTILNGGGSRAGKTYSIANVIYTIGTHYGDTRSKNARPLHIICYRDTLVSARDTYKDFIECFRGMGLLEGTQEQIRRGEADYTTTNSANVKIEIMGHLIEFKGLPEDGKEPTGCDIAFINELIEHKNQSMFDRIVRKVRLLVLADWNPKDSVHFAYDMKGHNIFYTVTTYWDNKHLPDGLKAKAEKECPWDFSESELYLETHDTMGRVLYKKLPEGFNFADWKAGVYPFDGFIRRKWLKEERPQNCLEGDFHLYRSVNKQNHENGTINRNLWLTYGEGVPSGQEGMVFPNPVYIDKFPDTGLAHVAFGLDLGLSIHPTVLVRCGWEDAMTRVLEYLTYVPMRTAEIIYYSVKPHLIREEERQSAELGEPFKPDIQIICDSQDRNSEIGENVVVELLKLAQSEGHYNWHFWKVKKPSILARLEIQKRLKLKVVYCKEAKTEFENYIFEDGKNNPIDDFNHGHDSWGYCEYSFLRFKK